jgi:S-adenosylmethionine-diacylglycerol 3-amino-3-carboxypropyl transferase
LSVNVHGMALALFDASTLEEQKEIFDMAEPLIWRGWMDKFLSNPALMSLVGVPAAQTKLIDQSHPGGLAGYIRDKFRQVMTRVPSRDNYFWRVYTTGSYTLDCCPNFLRRENLCPLGALLPRIGLHTTSIASFLQSHPGKYSHFVLLDHQDWLAWHRPEELREEWELLLANSRPGTRILLRSAGLDADFIPADIRERLVFHKEISERLHQADRVGTYGSLHLAEVR